MRSALVVILMLAGSSARAEEPPAEEAPGEEAPAEEAVFEEPPPKPPGVTLPKGTITVMVNLEAQLSKGSAFQPVSLAPDVSYGVTDDLTVALIHSTFGVTGFRGDAGAGLCPTGEDNGCPSVYNNVGADAHYGLRRGPFAIAAVGGVHALSLDPFQLAARAGVRGRWASGNFVLAFSPSVFVALTDRDGGNEDSLFVPLFFGYRVSPELIAAVGTGIKGPLDGFADTWTAAFVPQAGYFLTRRILVAASLAFPRIRGSSSLPDDAKGADFRVLQVWVNYTM